MIDLTNDIREMMDQKDMSFKEVKSIITDMLKSAYKRKFGTDENAEVKFYTKKKDSSRIYVDILAKKTVVEEEDYFNEVTEIPYDDAVLLAGDEVEVGDSLEIPLNPKTFEYSAVQSMMNGYIQDKMSYENSTAKILSAVANALLSSIEETSGGLLDMVGNAVQSFDMKSLEGIIKRIK